MLRNRGLCIGLATLLTLAAYVAWFTYAWPPKTPTQQQVNIHDPCKETDEKAVERCTNYRLAVYTGWLAVFTALLAVVGSVQIAFLIRADKTASTSADAAKLAANAAVEQSKLAGLQLDFVEKQHGVGRHQ